MTNGKPLQPGERVRIHIVGQNYGTVLREYPDGRTQWEHPDHGRIAYVVGYMAAGVVAVRIPATGRNRSFHTDHLRRAPR